MNKFRVFISGNFDVNVIVEAEDANAAQLAVANDFELSTIEELISSQGLSWDSITSIDAKPLDTGRYIVQAPNQLYHLYFEDKESLLQHLKQRARELYLGAVPQHDLYKFFEARNYFRAV